jgi:hypothetical protein
MGFTMGTGPAWVAYRMFGHGNVRFCVLNASVPVADAPDFNRHIFGPQIDLHSGGEDLSFPHHENEIAQCQARFGVADPWCPHFFHTGLLREENGVMSTAECGSGLVTLGSEKMSKSLGNGILIKASVSLRPVLERRRVQVGVSMSIPYPPSQLHRRIFWLNIHLRFSE